MLSNRRTRVCVFLGLIMVGVTGCSAGTSAPEQSEPVPITTPAATSPRSPSASAVVITTGSLHGVSAGLQMGARSVVLGGTQPKKLFVPGASEPRLISCADEVSTGETRLSEGHITVQLTDKSPWAAAAACPMKVAGSGLSAATNVARILLFGDDGALVQSFDAEEPADSLDNVLLVGDNVILAIIGTQTMSLNAFSGASGEAVWQRNLTSRRTAGTGS